MNTSQMGQKLGVMSSVYQMDHSAQKQPEMLQWRLGHCAHLWAACQSCKRQPCVCMVWLVCCCCCRQHCLPCWADVESPVSSVQLPTRSDAAYVLIASLHSNPIPATQASLTACSAQQSSL